MHNKSENNILILMMSRVGCDCLGECSPDSD